MLNKRTLQGVERVIRFTSMIDVFIHSATIHEIMRTLNIDTRYYGCFARPVIALVPEQVYPANLGLGQNNVLQVQVGVCTSG